MYTREQVIECYQQHGNIAAVTHATGCPPYIAYKWLAMARLLRPQERANYGTQGNKLSALAEMEFKKLVPFAMDANRHLQNNNPVFDFDVGGQTVDVKWSKLGKKGVYIFEVAANKAYAPDWFALFCGHADAIDERVFKDSQYHLVLLPAAVVMGMAQLRFPAKGSKSKYWEFEIPPAELAGFFKDFIPAPNQE